MTVQEMTLQELKAKSPIDLLAFAEELAVENASAMRKQRHAVRDPQTAWRQASRIVGVGVLEVLPDRVRLPARARG